jgi:tRNA (mo5U34)-methyltransferase
MEKIAMDERDRLAEVRKRQWFYDFDLPDGSRTRSYLPPEVANIHPTRVAMLFGALDPIAATTAWSQLSAVDIACHQGYFANLLARKGCRDVLGLDVRTEHLDDARLMAQACGLTNMRFAQADINSVDATTHGTFDISLMLGLLYHIENPVGALRTARALTRRACVIETQVTPNMTGVVDWGSYQFQRTMIGSLALIDEMGVTDNPESSTTGICIVPSYEALVWMLRAVGFRRVERIMPPEGAYEQLASGKRVMVIAYVE